MSHHRSIALKALAGVIFTPLFYGTAIFLSAGTLRYWEAWVFLIVFSIATALLTFDVSKHDPELLERRMHIGPAAETRPVQKLAVALALFALFLTMVVPAFDHRFGWSQVPPWLIVFGDCGVILSYLIFFWVMRENSFAAATIQVAKGQRVISTGPYAIVRHPMYAGALVLMIGIPLALGSYWALLVVLAGLPGLHLRIVDEETCLVKDLEGYVDYRHRIRYRMIPGIY